MKEMVTVDFKKAADCTRQGLREMLAHLEIALSHCEQKEFEVIHRFSHGVYSRELRIPKGSIIVGKIHKFTTTNVLSGGDVSVISQDGVVRLKAPFTYVSTPGAKRLIMAHEDSIWTTFHGTFETDLAKIEDELIAKDYSEVVE